MGMLGIEAFAYDIVVENSNGVTICYNYIHDGTELEVTSVYSILYSVVVNIPETVTHIERKVLVSDKNTIIKKTADIQKNVRRFFCITIDAE